MADFFKTNFKAQTLGEEPLGNIFDLLTPEERSKYAKAYQPTKSETVFTGLHGLADVFGGAFNNKNPTYMKDYQKEVQGRMDQDMQFVGNELTRKYAERQAKAAAEKAGRERLGVLNTIEKDYPGYFDQDNIAKDDALNIYGKKGGWDSQRNSAEMAAKSRAAAASRLMGKDDRNLKIGFIKSFNQDPNTRKYVSQFNTSKDLASFLSLKNPIADNSVKIMFARAAGEVGNLAQPEQAAFGGSKEVQVRLDQIFENLKTGTFSDENRKYLQDLASVYEKTSRGKIISQGQKYSKQYGQIFSSPEELFQLTASDPDSLDINPMSVNSQQYAPNETESYSDIDEEIAALEAKQRGAQ
jgi:hypothetical protein